MADLPTPAEAALTPPPDPPVKVWQPAAETAAAPVREIGGRKDGTDPTRYGDWEKNGRCIDF